MAVRTGTTTLKVCVVPRASKTEIVGPHYGALKVRLAAPPVDGAANRELIKLLARTFDVPKSSIEIASGDTAKTKLIRISGVAQADVDAVLRR